MISLRIEHVWMNARLFNTRCMQAIVLKLCQTLNKNQSLKCAVIRIFFYKMGHYSLFLVSKSIGNCKDVIVSTY